MKQVTNQKVFTLQKVIVIIKLEIRLRGSSQPSRRVEIPCDFATRLWSLRWGVKEWAGPSQGEPHSVDSERE